MINWLENDYSLEIPMTPELAKALEEGLSDSRTGRVISLEEYNRRHLERRAAWIKERQWQRNAPENTSVE